MINNSFKIAIRNFRKNKLSTVINLSGFSIGLAIAFFIFSFVRHEISYDNFHENADRIYRINVEMTVNGASKFGNITPNILGPKAKTDLTGVAAQFRMTNTFKRSTSMIINGKPRKVENFFSADSTIFDVFSINIIRGSHDKLLTKAEDIIISRKTAMKFFGGQDVIGQTFRSMNDKNYIVRAVFEDFPTNSHIHPNFLASSLSSQLNKELTWDQINYLTFVLLDEKTDPQEFQQSLNKMVDSNLPEDFKAIDTKYSIMPLTDIHLKSNADFELEPVVDISRLYAYLAIAIFVIIIACINYINMATSQALERAKEVGLRKVVGARKWSLIWQFMTEAWIITFISLLLAIAIFESSIPVFNSILDKSINISMLTEPHLLGYLLLLSLILGLLAGVYPSLALTSFKPVHVLKGSFKHSASGNFIRKSLVVFQFVISSVLIVGTLVVYNQVNYMKNKNLGFDKDQIIILKMDKVPDDSDLNTLKAELLSHSNIQKVSFSNAYPGQTSNGMLVKGDGMNEGEEIMVWNWQVDNDYLETMGIELLEGRDFSNNEIKKKEYDFIINESAMHDMNWNLNSSVGNRIDMGYRKGVCIGVAKDFHFSSLQMQVEPVIMHVEKNAYRRNVMVRFGHGDIGSTIDFMKNKWKEYVPQAVFEYRFLDESFDQLFASEQQIGKTVTVFSILSILIASMGLFGLSAHETLSRTKEMGIRKSIGLSNTGVFVLLVKQFSKLALLAFAISVPLGYFIMNNWLQSYAFRTTVGWHLFLLAAILTFLIVLISIAYHAIKAAKANPVDSLRYE